VEIPYLSILFISFPVIWKGTEVSHNALLYFTLQVIVNGSNLVWVVILSIILVKARYKLVHYVAMLISTVGMVVLIFEDLKSKHDDSEG